MQTQNMRIKQHLLNGFDITPMKALKMFGCFRLGARIWDLKKEGLPIKSEMILINKKHFKRYFIEK